MCLTTNCISCADPVHLRPDLFPPRTRTKSPVPSETVTTDTTPTLHRLLFDVRSPSLREPHPSLSGSRPEVTGRHLRPPLVTSLGSSRKVSTGSRREYVFGSRRGDVYQLPLPICLGPVSSGSRTPGRPSRTPRLRSCTSPPVYSSGKFPPVDLFTSHSS